LEKRKGGKSCRGRTWKGSRGGGGANCREECASTTREVWGKKNCNWKHRHTTSSESGGGVKKPSFRFQNKRRKKKGRALKKTWRNMVKGKKFRRKIQECNSLSLRRNRGTEEKLRTQKKKKNIKQERGGKMESRENKKFDYITHKKKSERNKKSRKVKDRHETSIARQRKLPPAPDN